MHQLCPNIKLPIFRFPSTTFHIHILKVMLPSTRPLARTLVAASVRATSIRATTGIAQARALHNKADPAIPGDATGFLPGDKITGETQIGSYPNLPMYNQQWRDANPSAGYWDRQDRRNFGETVSFGKWESLISSQSVSQSEAERETNTQDELDAGPKNI